MDNIQTESIESNKSSKNQISDPLYFSILFVIICIVFVYIYYYARRKAKNDFLELYIKNKSSQ